MSGEQRLQCLVQVDQANGQSKFRVCLHDQLVDEWVAEEQLPRAATMGGDSSIRRTIKGLAKEFPMAKKQRRWIS